MALPGVSVRIEDGQMGILPAAASGRHVKIGVASDGPVGQIVRVGDAEAALETFGTGPLVSSLLDSFGAGARLPLVIRAEADIPGTIGQVTATKTGGGDMSATGSPLDAYRVRVEIVDTGRFNTATFRYSLDGGVTWSGLVTVPDDGKYTIAGTGITVEFQEDNEEPPSSFAAGDLYAFDTVAPQASVQSVNAAIDVAFATPELYELIHVVGDSDSAMWAALATRATEAEANFRYIHFVAEARGPEPGETLDEWVDALIAERSSVSSSRASVVAGRGSIPERHTGLQSERNGAGVYVGRLMSIPVQRAAGRVRDGALPGIAALPDGYTSAHAAALDGAGFVTFMQYIGLSGVYVANARMLAEPTSDFQHAEHRRVMDKACQQVRIAALAHVHDDIPGAGEGQELAFRAMEAYLRQPLDEMAANQEITSGRVTIPRDQNILAAERIRIRVGVVPRGYLREIAVVIGFENPFLQEA